MSIRRSLVGLGASLAALAALATAVVAWPLPLAVTAAPVLLGVLR